MFSATLNEELGVRNEELMYPTASDGLRNGFAVTLAKTAVQSHFTFGSLFFNQSA